MKYANKINAKYVIIVGEEIREGKVTLRNMETGEQKLVYIEKIGN